MSVLTMPGRVDAPVGRSVTTASLNPSPAARLMGRVAHALSIRRAARHLSRLDDRMPQDIGLQRCGIGYAVRTGRDLGRA